MNRKILPALGIFVSAVVSAQILTPLLTYSGPLPNPAFVQGVGGGTNNTTSITVSITPTAGNTLIACAWSYLATVSPDPAVKTNGAVSFTHDLTTTVSGNNGNYCYHLSSIGAGVTSVVLTDASSEGWYMCVMEFSNLSGTAIGTDSTGAQSANNGNWATGTFTPTAGQNGVIIGIAGNVNNNNPMVATAPYITTSSNTAAGPNPNSGVCAYRLVTSTTGSYTPVGTVGGTTSGFIDAVGIAYK